MMKIIKYLYRYFTRNYYKYLHIICIDYQVIRDTMITDRYCYPFQLT